MVDTSEDAANVTLAPVLITADYCTLYYIRQESGAVLTDAGYSYRSQLYAVTGSP